MESTQKPVDNVETYLSQLKPVYEIKGSKPVNTTFDIKGIYQANKTFKLDEKFEFQFMYLWYNRTINQFEKQNYSHQNIDKIQCI